MKKIFSLLLIIGTIHNNVAQEKNITEAKLKDSILIKVASNYIKLTKQMFPDFKKAGYIEVYVQTRVRSKHGKGSKIIYKIKDVGTAVDKDSKNYSYPNYYTFIDDKLIVIHNDITNHIIQKKFTKNSKRKFRKILDPYLHKKEVMIFWKDKNGKLIKDKNWRPQYKGSSYYGIILEVENKTFSIKRATHYD